VPVAPLVLTLEESEQAQEELPFRERVSVHLHWKPKSSVPILREADG
jgi:hypothetical protein